MPCVMWRHNQPDRLLALDELQPTTKEGLWESICKQ